MRRTGLERPIPGLESTAIPLWLRLPAWMFIYLSIALLVWVVLTALATPWQPTIVTSGSMSPAVRPGDVVFMASPQLEDVAQESIVVFRAENGERVLHRIFSVESDRYLTKGDANPTPDTDPLRFEQIEGVGRMVVPFAGLPVVWWLEGRLVPLSAWLILTSFALVNLLTLERRKEESEAEVVARAPVAQVAIRQVRILVAFTVLAQFVVDPSRFAVVNGAAPPWAAMALTVVVLALTNIVSRRADHSKDPVRIDRSSILGLTVDTLLVVVMVTATGSSGIGWILFALPIIEAAARSRLAGALAAWMALTLSTIGLRISIANRTGVASSVLLDDLEAVMNQLSVLLLIVVPAAFLADQLLSDVVDHRHATSLAEERSGLLQQVVDLGRRVTQLDHSLFDTLTEAVETLGFDGADIVVRVELAASWQVLATSDTFASHPVPPPGDSGSALTEANLEFAAVGIAEMDRADPEVRALAATGWGSLVRIIVPTSDETVVAVRAGLNPGREMDADAIDSLSLLLGQASVGLQNNQLLDDLRSLNERMQHDSTHDALTGLPNRVLLLERLAEAVEQAQPGSAVAVLFLDLNGFKPVNDRLGHEAGDELLRMVAGRLSNSVAEGDMVARLGGDEFTVIARGLASPEQAESIALRLFAAIDQPFVLGSDPVRVGTAIGIAYADQRADPAELLRQSDVAMYQAKGDRLVPFRHFEPAMDLEELRTARLISELEAAIEQGQIQMHYQPMILTKTDRIVGVESLIRWQHPELGAIPASDLLAVAEQAGFAAEMNRWILAESLSAAHQIRPYTQIERFFVAINASPTEIRLPTFVDHVTEALDASGMEPANVLIELSERLALDDDAIIPENLRRLDEIGIKVLLDDFGEGQTTLAHLRRLPLAGLKLDRSFLVNVDDHPDDEIIIKSMVSMAHELGIYVVAEGIETEFHRDVAARCEVDLLQGYGCGRPMPLAELLAFIVQSELRASGKAGAQSASAPAAGLEPSAALAVPASSAVPAAPVKPNRSGQTLAASADRSVR